MWGSSKDSNSAGSDEMRNNPTITTVASSAGDRSLPNLVSDDDTATGAKSLFSVYVGHESSDNMSLLSDDFHDMDFGGGRAAPQVREESMLANSLFTFRRAVEDDEGSCMWRETTLQAKAGLPSSSGSKPDDDHVNEELMSDLVKRLQEMAKSKASAVLRFPMAERVAIRDGEKRIVFVLPQLKNTKFTKEEFGRMTAFDVLSMLRDRPVLVDIEAETEDTEEGETLELF